MKLLFFGDSITDARRERDCDGLFSSYGFGYVRQIVGTLLSEKPNEYNVINRGISGNRVVDLYARIKSDVWNENPDVLTILVGVNDVWHEITHDNGVEIDRFEKIYSMLIEDTKKALPNVRMIILEPFILRGEATETEYDKFLIVKEYANVVKGIAQKYDLEFVPLQAKFDELSEKYGATNYLFDGVHPNIAGATLIAEEWLKAFKK